jgi:hypothetical protein
MALGGCSHQLSAHSARQSLAKPPHRLTASSILK